MQTEQNITYALVRMGFMNSNNNFMFQISPTVSFVATLKETVLLVDIVYKGYPTRLAPLSIRDNFDLYDYIKKVQQELEATKPVATRYFINYSLLDWLQTYQTGYTFDNFVKGCEQDMDCSFVFSLNTPTPKENFTSYESKLIILDNEHHNDAVNLYLAYFDNLYVAKITPTYLKKFSTEYNLLYEFAGSFREVVSHRRKSIIDELLPTL